VKIIKSKAGKFKAQNQEKWMMAEIRERNLQGGPFADSI
jgi:hypothetical protein